MSFCHFKETPTLHLRLRKPKTHKKVQWTETTVDNEHMDKKKSKCCCVYVKPKTFGESSSESEGECENCYGHVEMKNKKGKLSHDKGENTESVHDHKNGCTDPSGGCSSKT